MRTLPPAPVSKCEYLTRKAYLLATTTRATSSSRENNDISDLSNPTLPSASYPSTISWHQAALNSHLGKWSELNRVEVFSSSPHNSSSWGKAGDLLQKKTFDDFFHLDLPAEESWSFSLSKVPCWLPCSEHYISLNLLLNLKTILAPTTSWTARLVSALLLLTSGQRWQPSR